jgi:hypothetical protein
MSSAAGRAQLRGTGVLLLLAGLLPLAGVLNPAMWKTFSGSDEEVLRAVADHRTATEVSGWLIGAGLALAIPAVAGIGGFLGTHRARLAVPLFATGAGLTLADVAFGLKVTYGLAADPLPVPLPTWYEPMNDWGQALFTAGTGVLGAVALLVCGWEITRLGVLPRWSGWVLMVAAVLMLGQVAAFAGLLPAPQFLALTALGVAALVRSRGGAAPDGTASQS